MVKVHGPRRGELILARRVRVRQFGPALGLPNPSTPFQPTAEPLIQPTVGLSETMAAAQAWWMSQASALLAGFHSGGSVGQCTDYAAARRPDVIARSDIWAYAAYLSGPQTAPLTINWAAKYWATNARRAGIATGNVARPGALMVFQPGAYGAAAPDGHIAVVDTVARDGSFTISEMNAPTNGQISTRHFTTTLARAIATNPSVTFVY